MNKRPDQNQKPIAVLLPSGPTVQGWVTLPVGDDQRSDGIETLHLTDGNWHMAVPCRLLGHTKDGTSQLEILGMGVTERVVAGGDGSFVFEVCQSEIGKEDSPTEARTFRCGRGRP